MVVTSEPFPMGDVGIAPEGTGMAEGMDEGWVVELDGVVDAPLLLGEVDPDGGEELEDTPWLPDPEGVVLVGIVLAPASYLG